MSRPRNCRPAPGGGTREVTVDDAASALLRFDSGALGTMELAHATVHRPCDFTVEANGSHGTLVFGRGQRGDRAAGGLTFPYAAWVSAHARSSTWAMSSGG